MDRVLVGLWMIVCFSLMEFSCFRDKAKEVPKVEVLESDTSVLGRISAITLQINNGTVNPDLYENRAKLFLQASKYEEALQDMYRCIYIDSMHVPYYQTLADIYTTTGKGELAFLSLEKGLAINPEDHSHALKTATYALYLKNYTKALNIVNQVLKSDPFDPDAYFTKAMIQKDQGDLRRALSSLQTAVEQNPQHFEAYTQLGLIGMELKDIHTENYLDNAISIDPKSPDAWNAKGTFFLSQDKIVNALSCFRKSIANNPKLALPYYNEGYCLFVLDSIDQAQISFTKAIEVNSEYAEAYYNRGLCAFKKADLLDAQFNFEQAKRYKPGWSKPQEQLDKLNKR